MSLLVETTLKTKTKTKTNYYKNNNKIINYHYYKQPKNANNIKEIYYYLTNSNYILKKFNIDIDKQSLYFVNNDNFSEVIKIIINNCQNNPYTNQINISLTIPLKNSNYEYTTTFNNLDKAWKYLKLHIDYLKLF